jgi:hypothetical protein
MADSVEKLLEVARSEAEDSSSNAGSAAVSAARGAHIAGTTALLQETLDEQKRISSLLVQIVQILARQTVLLEGMSDSIHSPPPTFVMSPSQASTSGSSKYMFHGSSMVNRFNLVAVPLMALEYQMNLMDMRTGSSHQFGEASMSEMSELVKYSLMNHEALMKKDTGSVINTIRCPWSDILDLGTCDVCWREL